MIKSKEGPCLQEDPKTTTRQLPDRTFLTVAYVATTQNLSSSPHQVDYRAKDTAPHPDPPPEQPDTATSKPSSRSQHSASGRADDTRSTHWNASKGSRRRF